MDYCYLGAEDGDEEELSLPILVVRDGKFDGHYSSAMERQGATSFAVAWLKGVILELGFRRLTLKNDNEPAIVALRNKLKGEIRHVEILDEGPPPYDHAAIGFIEGGVKIIKRQCRVVRYASESRLGTKIPDDHACLAWLPTYACQVLRESSELERTAALLTRGELAADGDRLPSSLLKSAGSAVLVRLPNRPMPAAWQKGASLGIRRQLQLPS